MKQNPSPTQVLELLHQEDWDAITRLVEAGLVNPNEPIPDKPPSIKYWLLCLAVDAGANECALKLLENGAKPDVGLEGETPLISASGTGNHKMLQALLAAGADVNLKAAWDGCEGGETALISASERGDLWAVKRLLRAGADVSLSTPRKQTALFWGALRGSLDVVKELLKAGCPLQGNELHGPVYQRNLEMVRLLLASGANPNQAFPTRDPDVDVARGETPLLVALDLLPELGKLKLEASDRRRRLEITKLLLAAGADPNAPSASGDTPLARTVRNRELAYTKLLLAAGADPHFAAPGKKGRKLSPAAVAKDKGLVRFTELFKAARRKGGPH